MARVAERLSRPVRDRDGTVIATREQAKRYVMRALERDPHRQAWRHAAQLLIDQADGAAVVDQLELALVLEARLDLKGG